jgi:hypothetical protein
MGNLTINELSNSLNDYMDEKQNMEDHSLMTENKTIVSAINEIYGKQLIANAIGEPLNESDTFSAMSNDINSLLSTFKTNMMNNGITVESGDKFKALIDKIATLADNEGKGIQIVEGTTQMLGDAGNLHVKVTGLNFKPSILIVVSPNGSSKCLSVYIQSYNETKYIQLDNGSTSWFENNLDGTDNYINDSGFKLKMFGWGMNVLDKNVKWYAIGVGEEDTTIRDSLANILENKGVEVTEEDDMASLISKVDSIEIGSIRYEGTHTLISEKAYPSVSYTVDTGATKNIQEVWVITSSSDSYGRSAARIMVDSRLNYSVDTMLKPFSDVDTIGYYISNISGSTFKLNIVDTNNYGVSSYSFKWYAFT